MSTLLLGDIGGTNARFMLAPATGALPPLTVMRTADHPTLEAALGALLGPAPGTLRGAAFSVAGPVQDGAVHMTNCPWVITRNALGAATGVAAPVLINDFTALAEGLSLLGPGDIRPVGMGDILAGAGPLGLLGPGTGLGVSGLIPDGRDSFVALAGEGGHADLPASSPREMAVVSWLCERRGHVSAESLLSGPGLETLYATLAEIDEGAPQHKSAAEIDRLALAGTDPRAAETIALFTGLLGAVAGNLALTLGATGGIYLGGGILPRWGALFDTALFRRRFEAKGRFAAYMARIPAAIITAPDVAFRGLRKLALGR
jgi:glucokinase